MTQTIRWGFLAPGGIAQVIANDFKLNGLHIEAVASRSLEKAQAFASKWSIPKAYGSYLELVADPNVDVIYISSVHNLHLEHALLAINAGKSVLIEKPFTLNAKQAQQIIDAATAKGVFAMEAMWTRFLPNHIRLFEILKADTIGQIRALIADHDQYLPESIAPRLHQPELGGGSIIDVGVYPISLASRVFGPPERILASASLDGQGLDKSTAMIFDYEGGAKALLHSSIEVAGPVRASIIGTRGRIEMHKSFYENSAFEVFDNHDRVIERFEAKIIGRGMHYQALEVEQQVRAGNLVSPIMSLTETLEIMKTMDGVRAQIGVRYPGE